MRGTRRRKSRDASPWLQGRFEDMSWRMGARMALQRKRGDECSLMGLLIIILLFRCFLSTSCVPGPETGVNAGPIRPLPCPRSSPPGEGDGHAPDTWHPVDTCAVGHSVTPTGPQVVYKWCFISWFLRVGYCFHLTGGKTEAQASWHQTPWSLVQDVLPLGS